MSRATVHLLLAAFVALTLGCDDPDASDEAREGHSATESADAGADASVPQIRTAFGIPLPPEGRLISESSTIIEWHTEMSVAELDEYYQGRLTDYEVLREDLTLRIVGLRSGMAHAFGSHDGKVFRPVTITFFVGELPHGSGRLKTVNLDGTEKEREPPKPVPPTHFGGGKKGSSVTARLPDGTLMAPGARWGEPYTPPKGSYYDKKKFKANWGRPFGDWRAF